MVTSRDRSQLPYALSYAPEEVSFGRSGMFVFVVRIGGGGELGLERACWPRSQLVCHGKAYWRRVKGEKIPSLEGIASTGGSYVIYASDIVKGRKKGHTWKSRALLALSRASCGSP